MVSYTFTISMSSLKDLPFTLILMEPYIFYNFIIFQQLYFINFKIIFSKLFRYIINSILYIISYIIF